MNDKLITSSGVITNRFKPRVGVINLNELNHDMTNDIFEEGINLSYEIYIKDLEEQGLSEEEMEEQCEMYESDEDTYLFGDAWKKDEEGRYVIDKTKNLAISYHRGVICVEFSKDTKKCHHTSPCYVMKDGSGPCGDLGTKGDAVIAYDVPKDWYLKEQKEEQ